jgi:hypothetical protein
MSRTGGGARSDERGDVVLAAKQCLAVDLVADDGQHDGVPGGDRGVAPDPLQRARLGEAGGTVRVQQDVDRLDHVVDGPAGVGPHPFTRDDAVGKFDQLVAARIDSDLANEIKDAVRSLENIQVKDLMALLARVRVD